MLKIALCDDDKTQLDYGTQLLHAWADKHDTQITCKTFMSAESFLFQCAREEHFDILLLDIEMGAMNGVELAKEIRKTDDTIQIVFITGFPDFIAEGYDVSALHYMMKPIDTNKFEEVMSKAVKRHRTQEQSIIIRQGDETVRIALSDILYIESFGHYSEIHTTGHTYRMKKKLSEFTLDESFAMCHRSYLVGLRHIAKIGTKDIYLENDHSIPVSRRMYQAVNQAFIRYFKGEY